ncbi:riboflavin synthase [Chloroflexota bacterium]
MFTGIIEEIGKVKTATSDKLTVDAAGVLEGMELGGSISVNGACLTITKFGQDSFTVDIMPETKKRTSTGMLKSGDSVNLERPLTLNKPLGGHLVQGHVDGSGTITSIIRQSEASIISIETIPEVMRYIVEKGFVAIDGISLTVVSLGAVSFAVSIVEHTLKNTILGSHRSGDTVNIEVDIIAKYVERFNKKDDAGVTLDFLKEQGFITG